MSQADRFLCACRQEPVDATPVWLMRQAGRYMAEYRALRQRYSILELIKTPELAMAVTMQPVQAFNLDAAIIFADILTILEGLGLHLDFIKGEGPSIDNPLRTAADVEALTIRPAAERLPFTLEAIKLTVAELGGKVPLIGFAGAPFTLASYAIEGGSSRNYIRTKGMMYQHPQTWHKLMEKLAMVIGEYLHAQAEAGAQALQLFDSWVGALSPADYREFVLPHTQRAIEIATSRTDVPFIHFGTGTAGMLPLLKQAGGSVIGVDWRIELAEAAQILGDDVAIQGNLDPVLLFAPADELKRQASRLLDSVKHRPGHIFNVGHGILQHTPVENVALLVDFVHEYSQAK